MIITKKMLRVFAFALSIMLLVSGFTSCVKRETGSASGDDFWHASGTDQSSSDQNDPESTPASESEVFTRGVKQVLLKAVEKSERMGSAQLDLLLNPGALVDESQSNYTYSAVNLVNTTGGESVAVTTESILDASTGDSSMIVSMQSGSEAVQSGGVYFVGDTMLLKKADVSKPMILHTLDSQVSASLKPLTAFDRLTRVLSNTASAKLNDDQWSAAVDTYLQLVISNSQEANFIPGEEAVTLAGTGVNCTTSTLSLTGEGAITVTNELLSVMAQDVAFKSYFTSLYEISQDEYGITGIDGMLRDLGALTGEERTNLALTFKLIQTDTPIGIQVSAVTGDKAFSLNLMFYENGYVKQNDIIFSAFDGSKITTTEQNVSAGGDNYTGQIVYELLGPGWVLQESSTMTTQSTITDSACNIAAQISYTRAATADMGAMNVSGTANYSQQNSETGSTGASYGSISISGGEDTSTINFDVSLQQSNGAVSVSAPEFIPAAGISTYDSASLYAALGEDSNMELFNSAPMTMRMLSAFLLLLY